MLGDRIEILAAGADGRAELCVVTADRVGRRVVATTEDGIVSVSEVNRKGVAVRTVRYPQCRVLRLVEYSRAGGECAPITITPVAELAQVESAVEAAASQPATSEPSVPSPAGPCSEEPREVEAVPRPASTSSGAADASGAPPRFARKPVTSRKPQSSNGRKRPKGRPGKRKRR
ncbi:hypothetical protein [Actinomadura atramentaria]|uniref:hypothetical protein n=1 Tax=Actinomadura atramentaria TaxID=1990 RepID=UPI000364CC1F|nr:hypothetical protein [Actinomadura atramentaria]